MGIIAVLWIVLLLVAIIVGLKRRNPKRVRFAYNVGPVRAKREG